jgi:hypothetical protein
MAFTPNGTLYLISGVLIDNKYQHTIDFSNATEQQNYFIGLAAHSLTDYTFMRKDSSIRVAINIETLHAINYALYRNGSGKWIYCFITDKKYINDAVTELVIQTDVMQTYLFDYTFKPSFIDREHMNRWDSLHRPILHYIDENINYGDDYIIIGEQVCTDSDDLDGDVLFFLVVSTEALEVDSITAPEPIQKTPTPLHYYIVPYAPGDPIFEVEIIDGSTFYNVPLMTAQHLCNLLGENPSVISVSYLPYLPFDYHCENRVIIENNNILKAYEYQWNDGQSSIHILKLQGRYTDNIGTKGIGSFDRYFAKSLPSIFTTGMSRHYKYESKLLTHPYFYYLLTDYQCNPLVVKNELLEENAAVEIKTVQTLSHQPKTKYFIPNYKGDVYGKANSLINNTVNDLPLKSDAYKNYIMQNKNSVTTGIALTLGGAALGLATGGAGMAVAAPAVMTGLSSVAGEMAKRKDLQNVPDNVRSSGNNISFDIVDSNTKVRMVCFEIDDDYKKVLGDYFALYGYKCNEVKVPNLKSRYYYNYIKTLNANITGNMSIDDLSRIKEIFDNGITFWHYRPGFNMLDYTYENIEVNLLLEVKM